MVGCQYPSDYVEFRNLPLERQRCEFSKLPLDKQVDFHFYAMSREPPDVQLGIWIAQRGDTVIPQLLQRLEQEPEDYRKEKLVLIFQQMQTYNYANLTKSEKTIERLKNVAAEMKDARWKRIADDYIKSIETTVFNENAESPPPPPCSLTNSP